MRINWTVGASQNLQQIADYIAQDKPDAAVNTVLSIVEVVELLVQNPALGRAGRVVGTRELIISNVPYIVPYRIKNDCIEILRVLHSSMQWPKKF